VTRPLLESLEGRLLFTAGPRQMEYLSRGVVATRATSSQVFVSWRLMAQDPAAMGFNVYRSTNGGAASKLNGSILTAGTNYTDTTASSASATYSYFVKPVISGVEQPASTAYTLPANAPSQPYFSVPLRNIGDYSIRHMNVADLNGDGQYDFVVGRKSNAVVNEVAAASSKVEAYLHDGTFLWSIDLGPGSLDVDNIEPGPTAIDTGNWDGVVAYDLDLDGKAEVFIRSANDVVFGDGTTLSYPANNDVQFLSAVDGMTGAERARIQIPTDYLSDGPMGASFAVGYLDGTHPSLVAKLKNRIGSAAFNEMFVAYDFDGTLIQKWKFLSPVGETDHGHNIRVVDVDQDGYDDIADTAKVINGPTGTLKYSMYPTIGHGDRFYIGDFDPARPGLEYYGVQQNNPSMMMEYYADAATGQLLYATYNTSVSDNGRGEVGDIDPAHPGAEYWSFYGLHNNYNSVHTQIGASSPWPSVGLQWDGDLLAETLNTDHANIDQWNPSTQVLNRVATLGSMGSGSTTYDGWPIYFGDMIGDWREEVIYEKGTRDGLVIFTTNSSTTTRLYTLAQNPLYRNNMTTKGYMQTRNTDYYLGNGMSTPPTPNTQPLDFGANAAPTVATPAGASPTSVNGMTVNLSVLGADDGGEPGLSYTWAAVGPGAVTFSTNKTNAAKNTTATFSAAGVYTFVATLRDAAGRTTTSRVNVTVNQTLTSVTVSPTAPLVNPNTTKQLTATGRDQFGAALATQPSFTWSVIAGSGTVNASGLYTAPSSAGSATVQAATGALWATANVTITTDGLVKAWWKLDESSGAFVTDSSGDDHHGTAVGPTWVTGRNGNALSFDGNDYVDLPTSLVSTTVGSVSLWVKTGTNFSTYAHVFYASPATNGDGIGPENELYIAYLADEHFSFFIKGASNVSIGSSSAYADNNWHHVAATWDINANAVLYVDGVQVASTAHNADVYVGSMVTRLGRPGAGTRYYTGLIDDVRLYDTAISASQVQAIYNEPLVPTVFTGSGASDTYYLKRNGSNLNIWVGSNGIGTPTYSTLYSSITSLTFNGNGGSDLLTIDASAGNPIPSGGISFDGGADADTLTFIGSTSTESISYSSGSLSIGSSTASHSNVESRIFNGNGGGDSLTINAGQVTFTPTQVLGSLTLAPSAALDLRDNDLVVNNADFATIQALVLSGFGNTTGIISSTSDGSQILALFDNNLVGATEWNGLPIGASAIVGKYTYFGDANLDGQVTGDDYTVIDANLGTTPSEGLEWLSGDMNLDGSVTGDDYTVIDANLGLGAGSPVAPSRLFAIPLLRLRDDDLALITEAATVCGN
jgi:hypothetical protein